MNKYKIEILPIGQVALNDKNPRLIKDGEFKKLIKSLSECPDLFEARPLICSDRTGELIILGGNMRYRAAIELKLTHVPVIIMSGLTAEQEKEIIVKDNGSFGEWDFKALADDWAELPLDTWGIELPGTWLADVEDDFNIEAAVSQIKDPMTRLGDIWTIGKHRLMCADSQNAQSLCALMGGVSHQ